MEVISVADALHWNSFILMGHSLGGIVATLTAGTIPRRVEKLIVLDAFPGPLRTSREDPAEMLESGTAEKWRLLRRQPRVYPSFEAALAKYRENNPDLKLHSAQLLVQRSTEEVFVGGGQEIPEKGYVFRHGNLLVFFFFFWKRRISYRKFYNRSSSCW